MLQKKQNAALMAQVLEKLPKELQARQAPSGFVARVPLAKKDGREYELSLSIPMMSSFPALETALAVVDEKGLVYDEDLGYEDVRQIGFPSELIADPKELLDEIERVKTAMQENGFEVV